MEILNDNKLVTPIVLCMDAASVMHMGPLIRSIRTNVPTAKIYLVVDKIIKPKWADEVKVLDVSLVTNQCVSWVNYMGWARLFIHDLWPDLKKCIYLDYDTIVLDDISDLITDSTGWIMKVAEHDTTKFNSGVIAFNYTQECLELLEECKSLISDKTHDQEVLQKVFDGRFTYVDISYNVCISGITTPCRHPKIIHYCGPQKPWQISNFAKYYFDYT